MYIENVIPLYINKTRISVCGVRVAKAFVVVVVGRIDITQYNGSLAKGLYIDRG